MNDKPLDSQPIAPSVRRAVGRWAVRAAAGTLIYGVLIFLPADTLSWVWGWVFLSVLVAVMAAHPLVMVPTNPEVLIEREKGVW